MMKTMRFTALLLISPSHSFHLPTSLSRHAAIILHSIKNDNDVSTAKQTPPEYQRDLRAGEEGYSLLRRPVTFDTADPVFDAPKSLNEDDERDRWFTGASASGESDNGRVDLLGDFADADNIVKITHENVATNNGPKNRQREEDQHLDMHVRSMETLDYRLIVNALSEECSTVRGKEIVWSSIDDSPNKKPKKKAKNAVDSDEDPAHMPLTAATLEGVHRRYDALQEMQALMDGRVTGWILSSQLKQSAHSNRKANKLQRKPLGRPPIEGMRFDLKPILEMLDRSEVLDGPEILDVCEMLEVCIDIMDWAEALKEINAENEQQKQQDNGLHLKQQSFVELLRLTEAIHIDEELFTLLTNAFDEEGLLSSKTFPTIGVLRSKVRTLKQSILSSIDAMLLSEGIQNKLATESGGALTMEINGRIVIPLQQQYQNLGIVHDSSRSGKTAYVEPHEVIAPTNELRQAEGELRTEETRVWRTLTETILKHKEEIEQNIGVLAQLDVIMGKVKLGKKLEGVVPEVRDEGVVSVKEARHPILLLRGIEGVVGSDVDIGAGDNQGLILTGPNSGGKTVILKLLGLYAFMVRDGIPIPSKAQEAARVDFFQPILADIGDLQSVDGDLSTFSGHMLVCREVLQNAQKNALVLMDELGSGTDPAQGVAIAQALLEALLDRGCRVAITTHYMELKQLASSDSRFAVAGMQFLGGVPTYRLIPGMIGESFAIAVAERLQLPQSVISRANELLDSDTRKMGELITNLEEQKELIDQKEAELKKKEFQMLELKTEMKRQQERLEAKQLNARREEAKKFAAKLEAKERLLEDILDKLKGGASKKVVADSWSNIRIVKREALQEAENVPGLRIQQQQSQVELIPISEMKGIPSLSVDDKVIVCKKGAFYGTEGIVQQVGKKIQVAVGDVSVRLTLKEIAFPTTAESINKNSKTKQEATISKLSKRGIDLEAEENASVDITNSGKPRDSGSTMKTNSNTVNCIGNTFEESKRKIVDEFSKAVMSNRSVVFILHGHGTGVLKQKIRSWLSSDRQWVKSFGAAEQADGGEALTKVVLKKQSLF